MKNFVVAILMALSFAAMADTQERWIMLGDSIQANVTEPSGIVAQARNLTSNRVPQLVNVSIQNISSAGMTMAPAGTNLDAYYNRTALNLIDGLYNARGVMITLGTNDWAVASITTTDFQAKYRATVQHAKALGLEVVCISPLWRADQDTYKASGPDSYQLWVYRWIIQTVCTSEGTTVRYVDGLSFTLPSTMFADGLHLNNAGHIAFGDQLITKMQAMGFWTSTYGTSSLAAKTITTTKTVAKK